MDQRFELTTEERNLVKRYLEFYKELSSGKRQPKTEAQKHFIKVCKGMAIAVNRHEKAYMKYRIELAEFIKQEGGSKKYGVRETEPNNPDNSWFPDSDWNKMHPDRRHH